MLRLAAMCCLLLALASTGGCGAGKARLAHDLRTLGIVYHIYHDEHKQGPPGWDELIKLAEDTNNSPESIRRVKDAGYQITWGAKFDELKDGTARTVMAKPPGDGPTLMMDGSVK